jgi:hypothetical protein
MVLSSELTCSIFIHLAAVDACSFRISCPNLEWQTRRIFIERFLSSPRVRLTPRHLKDFMGLCKNIGPAIKELNISLYMPAPSSCFALYRIEQELELSGKNNDYFRQYFANFRTEQSSDVTSILYRLFSSFEKLQTVSLSASTADIAEFSRCERLIAKELSALPYQRHHYEGHWRFMSLQRGRVIATTLQALGMMDRPILTRLVVDRRLHVTPHLSKNHPPNSFSRLHLTESRSICREIRAHGSFQKLHTLELSISEHCLPEHTLHRMWFVLVIQSAPRLRVLTLIFHHPIVASQLRFFLGLEAIRGLDRLTLSCVTGIETNRIFTTIHNLSSSLKHHNISVCTESKTICLTRRNLSPQIPNEADLQPNYGRLWITELKFPPTVSPLSIPNIDWGQALLRVVDQRNGMHDLRICLPRDVCSSWRNFVNFLGQHTKVDGNELQSRVDIIHVSTDGVPVLRLMDQMYMKSRAFEENVIAAACWSEPSLCIITLEICTDGLYWADQSFYGVQGIL